MIKKKISRTTFQEHLITLIKDELAIEAIKDDGIYSTFKFSDHYLKDPGLTKVNLYYCKMSSALGDAWLPVNTKIFYKNCPELGDVELPYADAESLKKASDRIKMDIVKKDNAIWSTIKIQPCRDAFEVGYAKINVDNTPDYIKWKPTFDPYVENTRKTLRRIQENSYYGLYPRHSGLTYAFDEKAKEDLKASLGLWKAKADLDIHSPSKELLFNYYNKQHTKEKEKKDMNITLMVVPEGMSNNFVRKVKANYQSNNSLRLFIASTDIDYSCEHEPIKTKYDLFEKWIKTGYVDIVYFMLGFEKDPDVKAFESFVRGITEFSGKVDVRVAYQRDDVLNDANNLRTAYFDEADAKEDLENAGNKVVKEAKTMQDIYGLDDEGLEAIKYSKGRIEISEGLIMDKIMEAAFALDDDAKLKKGGKK